MIHNIHEGHCPEFESTYPASRLSEKPVRYQGRLSSFININCYGVLLLARNKKRYAKRDTQMTHCREALRMDLLHSTDQSLLLAKLD